MNLRIILPIFISTSALVILTGCVSSIRSVNFSYDPGIANAPKINYPITLNLSKEFTSYEHVTVGATFPVHDEDHIAYGPSLKKYAIYVARSVFGDVQIIDGGSEQNTGNIELVPRVSSSDLALGSEKLPSNGALGVQWDFKDPKTGQVLFAMHVQCEASQALNTSGDWLSKGFTLSGISAMYEEANTTIVNNLMTNLTAITIQRFNASKDIQHLVGR